MANYTDEIVLSSKNVSKDFYLPHEKSNSIKSSIVNIFKKKDKEADTQHALKDISFDIKKGEFFGILGRNGSGKSTMLKIIAEIYQPTNGTVSHAGKLVPFIELGVGFNPELSGRENVYLNGALLGFSRKEIDARYDEIVKFAELEEFMDQKLKNYSSGMQVRLAFSVATHAEADILVVDEVLAVGDADFQRKCYDYFKALKKTGKTVIFVTHDMGAVREYCDRAILINNGLITYSGSANKVADEYLKLFNVTTDASGVDDTASTRWGNGEVKIGSVSIKLDESTLMLDIPIQSHAKVGKDVQVVCKFSEDGADDVYFAGTSLSSIDDRFQSVAVGSNEKKNIKIIFDNIFSSRKINLSLTLQSPDGVTMYDVWNNVTYFQSSSEKRYYSVYPKGSVEVR